MKVLGAFPADMCQVDRAWLVEKFSKSSTSSDSDTEVESKIDRSEVIMKEPGAYYINSAKFVEIEV
ncbi:hypothetical protein K7432_018432 [Basidiobolus ranarum]|uniref:Uncharacterized protein n=1 Tax=Basidiobolus ranarum TaxID=34480 RepID=A0ABR2VJ02_9FUNG